jgi:hypothetical protein
MSPLIQLIGSDLLSTTYVVRAFVKLLELLSSHRDEQIIALIDAIRSLMEAPEAAARTYGLMPLAADALRAFNLMELPASLD